MKLHMKSSLIALALGLAVSGSSFATDLAAPPVAPSATQQDLKAGEHQERTKPGRDHGDQRHSSKHRGGLEDQLNLSREQSKALRQSMRSDVSEQRAIVASYLKKLPQAEQDAMASELKASHDKHFGEFLATLSAEQQAKAKELFERFKAGKNHAGPGSDDKPAELPPVTH